MLLAGERHRLERRRGRAPVVPSSAAELRDSLHQQLEKLAVDSPEMVGQRVVRPPRDDRLLPSRRRTTAFY